MQATRYVIPELRRIFSGLSLHKKFVPQACHISHTLKRKIDYSLVPKLNEVDLEEQFVHGSGPGGSKVNTARNCVVLKHLPSGIVVKCHEHREVSRNQQRARRLLVTRLDNLLNGEKSVEAQTKTILEEIAEKDEAEAAERREKKKRYKEFLEQCSRSESSPTGSE